MKIFLVLPASEELRVRPGQRVARRRMLRFSILPLTTVAALTPPRHEVEICDENIEPLSFDKEVDIVGISFMTAVAPRAYQVATEFRRRGRIVVGGGYHPTFMPAEAGACFDALVLGDAEGNWEQLLADIEQGLLSAGNAPARIYKRDSPAALDAVPLPRRDLMTRAREYATVNAVQAGRGCRNGCRYCSITAFHQKTYRTRPLKDVLAEIRALPGDFMFVDDNIVADRDYARRLFEGLVPLEKRWVSQCSLTVADDPDMLKLMQRAGCVGLFIGIETTDPDNLASVGKEFNDAPRYIQRILAIKRQGIGVIAGIIVGMDNDRLSVFERTLKFLDTARIDALQLNIMTPLPGTPLFEDFKNAGRIRDYDWSHYDFRHTVIQPKLMSPADLQDGADWLYAQFYRLDRIILRTLRALFSLGPLAAWLSLCLNLTYRRDNLRNNVRGRNPALIPVTGYSITEINDSKLSITKC